MDIIRKNDSNEINLREAENGVMYLSFEALEGYEEIVHAFSTRIGGVSEGAYAAMNLSFAREPDNREAVLENYKRMAEAMGVGQDSFVLTYQEHSVNVRLVSGKDRGKGVIYDRDYRNVDGLITNERGITLGTFFADCIPLYFYDRKRKAIGLSHSGWRGTASRMGAATIGEMSKHFGTKPEDVTVCIGPGICQDCYQVSTDVYDAFAKRFEAESLDKIFKKDGDTHFRLNLWRANEIVLTKAGVPKENIHTSNICTACNPHLLYSHRVMGEKRGNMAAFLALR